MKKICFITLVLFSFNMLNAQNCREIALPYFNNNEALLDNCPAEKLDWICSYAHNAFYFTNDVPQGAKVFNISELKNVTTNEQFSASVVDLNTLNYYAFDFKRFQFQDFYHTIYFAIPNEDFHYLAVRSQQEMYERTEFPERFSKGN